MAKKIIGFIKLQVPAGKANPSPPIGPALGQRGLNIMEFCKAFNAQTQGMEAGLPVPVVITAYADKSFTFVMKTPPASVLIRKAANIEKKDMNKLLKLNIYFFLKKFSLSEAKAFGLDSSSVKVEKFPMIIAPPKAINLKRIQ